MNKNSLIITNNRYEHRPHYKFENTGSKHLIKNHKGSVAD